jgi:hypothetical protein
MAAQLGLTVNANVWLAEQFAIDPRWVEHLIVNIGGTSSHDTKTIEFASNAWDGRDLQRFQGAFAQLIDTIDRRQLLNVSPLSRDLAREIAAARPEDENLEQWATRLTRDVLGE